MRKIRLLKSILIPTLGISAIGTIAAVCTSCGCGSAIPVTGVSLNKISTTLNVGSTEQLTATVSPETATDKLVTLSSSDSSVATVNNGTITAVAKGTTVIIVTTNDGGFTAACAVTVNPIHVTSVRLIKTKMP